MAKVQNLGRLLKKLEKMPKQAKADIKAALDKGGAEIVASAKALVPKDDGILAGTIQQEPGRHELEITVVAGGEATTRPVRDGADASYDYAFAQETGTREMPANPFLRPAFRLVRKRVVGRVNRAVRKAGRDAANGS